MCRAPHDAQGAGAPVDVGFVLLSLEENCCVPGTWHSREAMRTLFEHPPLFRPCVERFNTLASLVSKTGLWSQNCHYPTLQIELASERLRGC